MVVAIEPRKQLQRHALSDEQRQMSAVRKDKAMTAELLRTVSTCVAALFVSTMLVTAATSMPLP